MMTWTGFGRIFFLSNGGTVLAFSWKDWRKPRNTLIWLADVTAEIRTEERPLPPGYEPRIVSLCQHARSKTAIVVATQPNILYSILFLVPPKLTTSRNLSLYIHCKVMYLWDKGTEIMPFRFTAASNCRTLAHCMNLNYIVGYKRAISPLLRCIVCVLWVLLLLFVDVKRRARCVLG